MRGERVWGFFPLSTHLKIRAGKVSASGFCDVSPHREGLAPVYAQFDRASANPFYDVAREDQDSLLRGLFLTSWLVEDFLQVNEVLAGRTDPASGQIVSLWTAGARSGPRKRP